MRKTKCVPFSKILSCLFFFAETIKSHSTNLTTHNRPTTTNAQAQKAENPTVHQNHKNRVPSFTLDIFSTSFQVLALLLTISKLRYV